MDEALNLCKRVAVQPPVPPVVAGCCSPLSRPIYTRPIVSSSIANSIAELKVGSIMRSTPKTSSAINACSASATLIKNQTKLPSITTVRSLSASILQQAPCSAAVPASSSAPVAQQTAVKEYLTVASTSKVKDDFGISLNKENAPSVAMSGMDANEDSSSSTHIDASVIEQCAREMLEFINQKVEDMVLNTKPPIDFSNIKVRAGERSLTKDSKEGTLPANVDDLKNRNKNIEESKSGISFQHGILKKTKERKNTIFSKGSEENKGLSTENSDYEDAKLVEPLVNNIPEKNVESKINAMVKDIEEENSDTLDAEIKDDLFTDSEPQTFPGVENRLEISKDDSTKILPLESCELSKDSSTEFAVCSPKQLEEEKEDTAK